MTTRSKKSGKQSAGRRARQRSFLPPLSIRKQSAAFASAAFASLAAAVGAPASRRCRHRVQPPEYVAKKRRRETPRVATVGVADFAVVVIVAQSKVFFLFFQGDDAPF